MFATRLSAARWRGFLGISLAITLAAAMPGVSLGSVGLTEVASGFDRPLYLTHAGDNRLFVVEQTGRVKIIGGGTFLDISDLVSNGGERGLLSLAFHPSYSSNGRFYVNYTNLSGNTVIAEFRVSSDRNRANRASQRKLMTISQPYSNHNGGWMGFRGKLLYIASGDGGGGGDPDNYAQNKNSLLGKILRINPLDPDGSGPKRYGIPPKNPFVGKSGRDEIWAYGLRNPWRCSIDRVANRLWCADVGQSRWEEINRARATRGGFNYGWRVMEGNDCYNPASGCNTSGKKRPIAQYANEGWGRNCSVTGGYVSRRSGAALYGEYIFGDYCSGNIWTISAGHIAGTPLPQPTNTGRRISSFGEGADGRIYLTDISDGKIYYVQGT